jgi:hypothetical protein
MSIPIRATPSHLLAGIPRCETVDQYFIWRRKVQIAAGPANAWTLINGQEEVPEIDDRDVNMNHRLSEAMVIVTTNISDTLITRTVNCENAREAWLNIEAYFQAKAANSLYTNRHDFNRME